MAKNNGMMTQQDKDRFTREWNEITSVYKKLYGLENKEVEQNVIQQKEEKINE